MLVGGPNARKDYHYNESEEFFYQLEGTIQIAIQTENGKEVIELNGGDVFLLPAKVPHSPIRTEGSRSEEHTSELQSRPHLVCRLLLEKKKISVFDVFKICFI